MTSAPCSGPKLVIAESNLTSKAKSVSATLCSTWGAMIVPEGS